MIAELLAQGGPWIFAVVFAAGVVTSLSPCLMAMAPVIMGYMGSEGGSKPGRSLLLSFSMVLGLSTSFTVLGLVAVSFGRVFGYTGRLWIILLGIGFIIIGLNYVKIINIRWPGLKRLPFRVKGVGGAYLVGFFFGLVASPCATGVLAAILGFVAAAGNYGTGAAMLFIYGLGHGIPLVILGTLVGSASRMQSVSRYWDHFSYVVGLLFVGVGVYLIATAI